MKEITFKLDDKIADYLTRDADNIGITSGEFIRYILGRYVQEDIREALQSQQRGIAIPIDIGKILGGIEGFIKKIGKEGLKKLAEDGALPCKNCTIKLKPEDIDNGKCGACGTPLTEMLGGLSGE